MKSLSGRVLALTVLAVLAWIVLAGASASKNGPMLQPDKLVILSTTDVHGETSPCG